MIGTEMWISRFHRKVKKKIKKPGIAHIGSENFSNSILKSRDDALSTVLFGNCSSTSFTKEIILLMLIFRAHFPVSKSSPGISQEFFIITGLHCRKYWFHRHLEDISYCLMISLLMLYRRTADVERSHFEIGTHQRESANYFTSSHSDN